MKKCKIYSYVHQIEIGKWKGFCIADSGNLFRDQIFPSEVEARQEVFQNVKIDLNALNERHECDNWYEIIESDQDSPEVQDALNCYHEFSDPTLRQTVVFKVQVWWLTACWYGRYLIQWFRYFKALFVASK
jgi:hypothetical protein